MTTPLPDAATQPALPGLAPRVRKVRSVEMATQAPVVSVVVDVPVAHMDHEFDYLVPATMDEDAVVGARVSVRLAGRDVPGYIVERRQESSHVGALRPLRRVVSPVPVLTSQVWALCGRVAGYYAGTRMDVVRLAVPPRHARTEAAFLEALAAGPDTVGRADRATGGAAGASPGDWANYRGGAAFLDRLRAGQSPRAAWCALPGRQPGGFDPHAPGYAHALAAAAAATAQSGRNTLIVAPTTGHVAALVAALQAAGIDAVAQLVADDGPAKRYREFLRVLYGTAQVVVGTRAAAYAPVPYLGLAVLWDEANDLHREQRTPYAHVGQVLAMRADQEGCGLLLGGWARSVQTQRLVESGWLRDLAAERETIRARVATVRRPEPADQLHGPARIPSSAFRAAGAALDHGPVLVQVPRAGYLPALACAACREQATCTRCSGPLSFGAPQAPPQCAWCGRQERGFSCPACGGTKLRAIRVGAGRTAEELGRAFPGVVVRQSGGQRVLTTVPPTPALVVATPGAEPATEGGYQAALLLDADLMTGSVRLGAAQDAMHRWLTAVALVRSSGQVWLLGGGAPVPAGALVRHDPVGFASRELAERAELRLPPAVACVKITGDKVSVGRLLSRVDMPADGEVVGPLEIAGPADAGTGASGVPGGPQPKPRTPRAPDGVGTLVDDPAETMVMALLRAPVAAHQHLAGQVRQALAVRSGRREPGTLKVVVDPVDVL